MAATLERVEARSLVQPTGLQLPLLDPQVARDCGPLERHV